MCIRVYITDTDLGERIHDIINNATLDENLNKLYYTVSVQKKIIYSIEGIFHISNNRIRKVIIKDSEVETIKVNQYNFILDKSVIEYDDEYLQLNPNHLTENVYVYNYYTDCFNSNDTKLVIEKKNNKLHETYFLFNNTNADIDILKKTIHTFLLELNLC